MSLVLVTGGSGFVGGHVVLKLLEAGHEVRTTVRDLGRETEVRQTLAKAGAEPGERLSFAVADLMSDAGWAQAAEGCEYVMHVASPFPAGAPKDASELIEPAREGSLRVLRAARAARVRRVVLTSSFAAVGYGHDKPERTFDERDWTNPDAPGVAAYPQSKAHAERAAWDFVQREGEGLQLATVNPVGIFGPALGPDLSTSIMLVLRLLKGQLPGLPRMWFGVVDVRDVADLHLRAMTDEKAAGERFLAVSRDFISVRDLARILKEGMGPAGKRVPTRQLPDFAVRLAALFDPAVRTVTSELGIHRNATSEKAQRLLGWAPRTREEAIIATAESLIALGLA